MGAALGFALVAPGPVAIGIFLALGLGLAAPYLAATIMLAGAAVIAPVWARFYQPFPTFSLRSTPPRRRPTSSPRDSMPGSAQKTGPLRT
jgi:hypothetical protein